MTALSMDELAHLAAKAELSEKLVLDTARETVERFRAVWDAAKKNLPMAGKARELIDAHAPSIELYRECTKAKPSKGRGPSADEPLSGY